jgi:hypothetical protein
MGVTLPALWKLRRGKGAIVATAIHDGQHIRSELHPPAEDFSGRSFAPPPAYIGDCAKILHQRKFPEFGIKSAFIGGLR